MRHTSLVRLVLSTSAVAMLAGCGTSGTIAQNGSSGSQASAYTSTEDIPWTTTNRYPEWFRKTYRYKELVGAVSNWQSVAGEWKGIPHPEIRMGTLQLDRGAIYPFHSHPAPELYYVIKGNAEWTVGTETFTARSGTAIHTPPHTRHQMINTGPETLELLFVWWAPGGDRHVLGVASTMLEGWNRSDVPDR